MRTLTVLGLVLATACSSQSHIARSQPLAPGRPTPAASAPPSATPPDEEATQAWLDGEIERSRGAAHGAQPSVTTTQPSATQPSATKPSATKPSATPANEEATQTWLDHEIERAPRVPPPAPQEPRVQVVERIIERPVAVRGYSYYDYSYQDPYWQGSYRYRSTFPIHTAVGAGVGAIIGHQSGHRGRGAWIGGSLGYLFDIGRCW